MFILNDRERHWRFLSREAAGSDFHSKWKLAAGLSTDWKKEKKGGKKGRSQEALAIIQAGDSGTGARVETVMGKEAGSGAISEDTMGGECERKRGVRGTPPYLTRATGSMDLPFTEMERLPSTCCGAERTEEHS